MGGKRGADPADLYVPVLLYRFSRKKKEGGEITKQPLR